MVADPVTPVQHDNRRKRARARGSEEPAPSLARWTADRARVKRQRLSVRRRAADHKNRE
jgi:hypothetical protein